MNTGNIEYQANRYLTHSLYFLRLTIVVFSETSKKKNIHFFSSSKENNIKDYDEETKWSDFNIILPTLFVFYHGLELTMKGLLILLNKNIKTNHKLTDLFNELENNLGSETELLKILKIYLDSNNLKNTPLGEWIKKNQLDINNLYEMLRYPTNKTKSISTDDYPLMFQGQKMLPFLEKLIIDSKKLTELTVKFYRETTKMDNP